MKTKFKILLTTLLSALCLTLAPLTWADEIDVELDIIDSLKDVEEFEFHVLELEGLDDDPDFEASDIPEQADLIPEVDLREGSETDEMAFAVELEALK